MLSFLNTQRKILPYTLLVLATIVMALLAVVADGTGDDGDSIYHYLFARYAFEHPANFFNHWAKPVFTIIAAPFAQMGFTAIKLLNVVFWGVQSYCTIEIARHFGIKNRWLLPLFAVLSPMNVTHTLSGLTEPMFATSFALAVLLLLRNRISSAYLIFSFLPFVRSEGLIILCPLLIYTLQCRQYTRLFWFPVGHIVMAFAGYWIHQDYWWVFNTMTYSGLQSAYGSGPWDHFINMMPAIIGIALSIMLIFGLIFGLFTLVLNKKWLRDTFARDETWLIYGMFICYFTAHSIFWWQGMFNSYGMLRVMLGIMPAIFLICLRGWNLIASGFAMIHLQAVRIGWVLFLGGLAWSFFGRIRWNDHFSLNASQRALKEAANVVLKKFPDQDKNVYYLGAYTASLFLDIDVFDGYHCRQPWQLYSGEPIADSSIIHYDDWFFGYDGKVPLERLKQDKRLVSLGEFGEERKNARNTRIHAFYLSADSVSNKWSYYRQWNTAADQQSVVEIGGKHALKLDAQHPFSPVFNAGVQSFPPKARLRISFDAFSEMEGNMMPGVLVFDVKSGLKTYDWHSQSLKLDSLPPRTWHTYEFIEELAVPRFEKDNFGTCIWNDVSEPLYINNFKVELLSD